VCPALLNPFELIMKRINLISLLFSVALFVQGCANDVPEGPVKTLEFITVEKTNHSAITDQKLVTIKDAKEWEQLWSQHTRNIQPPPSAPVIDFKEAMVIGVFLGTRSNTCYNVTIESVEQVDDKRLLVKYREEKSGAVCGQALTQPLHLISLKPTQLQIEFVALQ
jgi:hypothetical protein